MAENEESSDGETFELEDSRPLYLMTALLGALIGLDVLLPYLPGYSNEVFGIRFALIAAVLGGARTLYGSLEGVFEGQIGADLALAIAAIAAILIGQPLVAAEVVFIGMVGESLEAITFGRTKRELRALLELRPPVANVLRDGQVVEIPSEELQLGDRAVVKPGQRIPADGKVLHGRTTVDQSALTGESLPVDKGIGDEVYTGTLNQHGAVEFTVEKIGGETTFGQLLRLVDEAERRKAPLERTADRYARYFLPAVLTCAGLTYLVTGEILRTVAVLVVACPCALILATPAAVLAAVARLARVGVVLRGGLALERLACATALVFDKTGTLTEGRPTLGDLHAMPGRDPEELLRCAATAEQHSEHILAQVILRGARARGLVLPSVDHFEALPGAGVVAESGPDRLVVGNRRMIEEQGLAIASELEELLGSLDDTGQTALIVVRGDEPIGAIGVRDEVRAEAAATIGELRGLGFDDIALVTGDRWATARAVAQRFEIATVEAEQLPADKAAFVEKWRAEGKRVAMIGDGINDAPALAVSDVGLALGGVGANIAAEAGDVILMRDPLEPLPFAIRMARSTLSVIRQNIIAFAFVVNGTAILLSAWGILSPIAAAVYHQCGSLLVLLNSMRLLFFERWREVPVVRWFDRVDQLGGACLERLDPIRLLDWATERRGRLLGWSLIVAVMGYLCSGIVVIDADQTGMQRRFGRLVRELPPGLHVCLPAPFDRVTRLEGKRVRMVEIGYRSLPASERDGAEPRTIEWSSPHRDGLLQPRPQEGLMLTGDESLAELNVAVLFRVVDARRFLFDVNDPEAALRPIAEAVLRTQVARISENALLTTGRRHFEENALALLRSRVGPGRYDLGIGILDVAIKDVHPPLDVVRAYHDVSIAMEQREQAINQADAYRASTLLSAESDASTRVHQAAASAEREVSAARASRATFLVHERSHRLAPELTRFGLFWRAVEETLRERPKIVLDPDASRRRRIVLADPAMPMAPNFPMLMDSIAPGEPSADPDKR